MGLIKWLFKILALAIISLGAHGMYIWWNRFELLNNVGLFGYLNLPAALEGKAEKLFTIWELPQVLQPFVVWMTMRGIEAWIMPILCIVGGIMLWNWQSNQRI